MIPLSYVFVTCKVLHEQERKKKKKGKIGGWWEKKRLEVGFYLSLFKESRGEMEDRIDQGPSYLSVTQVLETFSNTFWIILESSFRKMEGML